MLRAPTSADLPLFTRTEQSGSLDSGSDPSRVERGDDVPAGSRPDWRRVADPADPRVDGAKPAPLSVRRVDGRTWCPQSRLLTIGAATSGTPTPIASQRAPAALVSMIPSATLFAVLNVSGQATTTSGRGRSRSDGPVEPLPGRVGDDHRDAPPLLQPLGRLTRAGREGSPAH